MRDINQLPKIPLHDYQKYAVAFAMKNPYCGLFLDLGLGKTLITLATLMYLQPRSHILIIAPKAIARGTWEAEIENWKIPFRTQSLLVNEKGKDLTKEKRYELYEELKTAKPTVCFINREKTKDLVDFYKSEWPFQMVIIDESQSFKSSKSERFKSLKKVRPYINRLILLTGTPTPKSLEDIWSQIYLLDQGKRLGPNISRFRDAYFKVDLTINNVPVKFSPLNGAEDEIYNKIKDIVISMKNTKLKLPNCSFTNIYAHMDTKETQMYKELMKTNILELAPNEEIEAVNAAVLSGKLRQMASGALYTGEGKEYVKIHSKKLEILHYIKENTSGNLLVAYNFNFDKYEIKKYFEKHKVNDEKIRVEIFDGTPEMIKEWNEKKIDMMLLHPASGGFGLNLQHGGSNLVWFTIPESLEHYLQTNGRLYRQGQKNNVNIFHILTKGTIDEKRIKDLERKDSSQKALLEAIEFAITKL